MTALGLTSSAAAARAAQAPRVRRMGRLNARGLWTLYRRCLTRPLVFWIHSLAGPAVSSLLFLTVFVLARAAIDEPVWDGVDLASFVAPGLIAYAFCHAAFEAIGMYLVYDKMEGMVQDQLSAPLTPLELVLGWVLGAATAALCSGSVVALVFLPFVEWPVLDLLRLVAFALLGSLLFATLGLLVGLWARKWDHYSAAETFLILPLGLLSGTFFVRDDLPALGADLLLANPVFHVIDGFRGALLGRSDSDPLLGLAILAPLLAAVLLVAWRLVVRGWHLKA